MSVWPEPQQLTESATCTLKSCSSELWLPCSSIDDQRIVKVLAGNSRRPSSGRATGVSSARPPTATSSPITAEALHRSLTTGKGMVKTCGSPWQATSCPLPESSITGGVVSCTTTSQLTLPVLPSSSLALQVKRWLPTGSLCSASLLAAGSASQASLALQLVTTSVMGPVHSLVS